MFGNISKILEMKKQAEEMKQKMDSLVFEKTIGGVTIRMEGMHTFRQVSFDEEYFSRTSRSQVEQDLLAALNAVMEDMNQKLKSEFSQGLGLPPIPGL
jgi:DNA-binding protein YbaB